MLVEGNSAASTFRNACDPDTQAAFMFRGVVANAFKCSLSEIMQNAEWRDLVTVLRTGIGPKFDVNKLHFDRINIFTDEDIALRKAERILNLYNVRDVVAVNIYQDTNMLTPIDTIIHKDWIPRK